MQRREAIELFPGLADEATTARSRGLDARIGLIGLTGMILLLLLGAPSLTAEPAKAPEEALPHVSAAPPAAVMFSVHAPADHADRTDSAAAQPDRSEEALDVPLTREDIEEAVPNPPATGEASVAALEELIFMSNFGARSWKPTTVDEALAIAVANGSGPDLERPNPFRKRSRDIFRTNFRRVTIGRAEMLMRLRLRAKMRKAISLEVRF
jgi:hypothetical protein